MTEDTPRRPGRPRKHAPGRVHATVRFAPDRYLDLKKAADAAGRSISEEVEGRVERLTDYEQMFGGIQQAREMLWSKLISSSPDKLREAELEAEFDRRYGGFVIFPRGQKPVAASPRRVSLQSIRETSADDAIEEALGRVIEARVTKAVEAAVSEAVETGIAAAVSK